MATSKETFLKRPSLLRWDEARDEEGEEAASDEEMELAAVQLPDNLTFISTNNQVPVAAR